MTSRLTRWLACSIVLLACSDTDGTGGGGGGSGTATLGNKSFVVASGIARVAKSGTVSIVLSDKPALCNSMTTQTFHRGETLLQAYSLSGTAPGTFTSSLDPVKYARISDSCPSGSPINDHVVAHGRTKTSKIMISELGSDRVRGTFEASFEDGSSASLSFDVPTCADTDAEKAMCE